MIAYIKGILAEITEEGVVVEAAGVGYGIAVPSSLLPELPGVGEEVKLYTYFQVAEDMQKLYGFGSREDRKLFTNLLKVSGIGPKLAMGILSYMNAEELQMAVLAGDVKALSKAPGLGKKTAEKLILELKDSFSAAELMGRESSGHGSTGPTVVSDAFTEATEALMALGYSSSEALKAVRSIEAAEGMSTDEILQVAFAKLAAF